MIVYWMDGLRILFDKPDHCVRINLGRAGYLYWECGGKHGVVNFWKTLRRAK